MQAALTWPSPEGRGEATAHGLRFYFDYPAISSPPHTLKAWPVTALAASLAR